MKNSIRARVALASVSALALILASCSSDVGTQSPGNENNQSAVAAVSAASSSTAGDTDAAAAGDSGSQLAASDVTKDVKIDDAARTLLPADIRDRGTLKVGGETSLPPYLFLSDGKLTGIEAELMDALGRTLGLKIEVANTKFAAMVVGLVSHRVDIAMSDFSDTLERQKQVTFVDYTISGQILVVAKGNPKNIKTVEDLCGHSASGPAGSLSAKIAQDQSDKCVAAGKPAVDVQTYPSGADTELALQNGRTDATAIDYAIGSYQVQQKPDKLELAGEPFAKGYHGAAVGTGDKDMQAALEAAFNSMIKSGVYGKILEKWKVPQMAVDKVLINGTTE